MREATLLEDLQEARLNSSQNMKGVREELRAAEVRLHVHISSERALVLYLYVLVKGFCMTLSYDFVLVVGIADMLVACIFVYNVTLYLLPVICRNIENRACCVDETGPQKTGGIRES